ncbi:MAG: hypothetical protein Q7U16_12010 [Agitococcus sp.]|nr:hypothetical protein [Agitococcus sp.]
MLTPILTASCVSVSLPSYPKNWSPVREADSKCPNLTGIYYFLGEDYQNGPDGVKVQLIITKLPYPDLFMRNVYGNEKIDFVKITGPRLEELSVSYLSGSSLIFGAVLKENEDFLCANGKIYGLVNGKKADRFFGRSSDGAIISSFIDSYGMPIGMLPTFSFTKQWARWMQVNQPEASTGK